MPEHVNGAGDIRSAARGPHWIAWRADAAGNPERAIVIIGKTREEAEARAVEFWERNAR